MALSSQLPMIDRPGGSVILNIPTEGEAVGATTMATVARAD